MEFWNGERDILEVCDIRILDECKNIIELNFCSLRVNKMWRIFIIRMCAFMIYDWIKQFLEISQLSNFRLLLYQII